MTSYWGDCLMAVDYGLQLNIDEPNQGNSLANNAGPSKDLSHGRQT